MDRLPADLRIDHLLRTPEHVETVARMIHREFWVGVPGGLTEEFLVDHLRHTGDLQRLPLSWVALSGGQPIGTVNLIDNDDAKRAHLHPWLAAMVVLEPWRGRGIGTRSLAFAERMARELGATTLHLEASRRADGPVSFYAQCGFRDRGYLLMSKSLTAD